MEQDYLSYPETRSNYLDGRYFGIVVGSMYEATIQHPLKVKVVYDTHHKDHHVSVSMKHTHLHQSLPNLIRVVIHGHGIKHSCLLIVSLKHMQARYWNPKRYTSLHDHVLHRLILEKIRHYLSMLGDISFQVMTETTPEDEDTHTDVHRGYCNAYVIKYADDIIHGREPQLHHIRRYAAMIESKYHHLLTGEPDIEYDGKNTLIGGGIGFGVGAILGSVAGPGGAIIGGTLGGLTGAAIGSTVKK